MIECLDDLLNKYKIIQSYDIYFNLKYNGYKLTIAYYPTYLDVSMRKFSKPINNYNVEEFKIFKFENYNSDNVDLIELEKYITLVLKKYVPKYLRNLKYKELYENT